MNYVVILCILCVIFHHTSAPPPRRNEQQEKKQESHDELEDFGLEYNRYLKEVVDLLESDPVFKSKLENAQEADIRSGKIAQELDYVDHKVRTKLDEVKRQELERLRHLAQKQYELTNGIDTEHMKISSEHLDHENPHTFEMEDLKKLIAKVSADLVKADEKRRQEFKEYEMQKEFEKQEKLKHLEGSEKEAFEKQLQENETKHKQHEPLHHPGSKQQLEEVWEKQDHMENQEFDPKVFFQLHDLDGNGVWDQNEVKTLFLKELDKMYEQGLPEDDMRERAEEMERMREQVFKEMDKNNDGLINYKEFFDKTKEPDFEKDPGWESLDQKPAFTMEEYKEFERRRQEEVQRLIQQGMIPPQPIYHEYGYPGQPVQAHGPYNPPPMGHGYPAQMPQGHSNQYQGYNQHQSGGYQNQPQPQGQRQQQNYHQPPYQQNQPQFHQQPPQQFNQNQQQQHFNQHNQQQQFNQHNQQQQQFNQNQQQQQFNQNHQQQPHFQQNPPQQQYQHNSDQQQHHQTPQQHQSQPNYEHQQTHDQHKTNNEPHQGQLSPQGSQSGQQGFQPHANSVDESNSINKGDSKPNNADVYGSHSSDPGKIGNVQRSDVKYNSKSQASQSVNHL